MKKWLFFLILSFITVILQSTLFNYIPSGKFKPDVVLMICIYMGLFQPGIIGVVITVLTGFLTDIVSGAIFGTNLFLSLLLFSTASLLSEKFYLLGIALGMFFVFLLAAFHGLTLILLLYISGKISIIYESMFLTLLSQAVLTALISPLIFLFFNMVVES